MKDNEYKCAICGGEYTKGWSDEEAEKESNDIWGKIPEEEKAVICDDCFNQRTPEEVRMMGEHNKMRRSPI